MSRRKPVKLEFAVVKMNEHKTPPFIEVKGKEYIYYGTNNDYPQYLLELYNRSAKHNAIIEAKAAHILGKGWSVDRTGLSIEEYAKLIDQTKKANPGENLDHLTFKAILDMEIFGGFALEVIWNKAKTRPAEVRHVDFAKLRSNGDGSEFYFTSNWFNVGRDGVIRRNMTPEREEDWTVFKPYNKDKPGGRQLLYFKTYRPMLDVYPLPGYTGAIPYIEIDTHISNFHLNNLKNGFSAGHLIFFYNGIPTAEEQKKIERDIKAKFAGSDNAGKFVLIFSDGRERGSEVQPVQVSDLDKQYDQLNKTVQQEIFSGHRVTSPMLLGIKTEGQLGGRTELIEANELFQNNYITPKQQIVESVFNDLFDFGGRLKLTQLEPIGFAFTEQTIVQVLPPEAIRDLVAEKMGIDLTKYQVLMKANFNRDISDCIRKEMDSGKPHNQAVAICISKQEQAVIEALKKRGKKREKTLYARPFHLHEGQTVEMSEQDILREYFATITPTDRAIIDLLMKDNLMPAEEMSTILRMSPVEIGERIDRMVEEGLINKVSDKGVDGRIRTVLVPTPPALDIIENNPARTANLRVVYKYDWIPTIPESERDSEDHPSRDFCKELMALDKEYTRDEIESLRNDLGTDVWETRGGWWRQSGTDVNIPSCRHVWQQKIVIE